LDKSQWFAEILRIYEKRLLRFAFSKVPRDLAHEMVQECFLRLWREEPSRIQGREGPWLFSVTRNLCLDWLKGEGKRKTSSLEAVSLSSPETPVLNQLVRAEEENELLKLVAHLDENQQEVLRLKFQEEFSYKEISEITGHSVSYVGVLIHEAIVKLREGLVPRAPKAQGDAV
jgi:RNA polymerase sigma factor (sigma-70 family)